MGKPAPGVSALFTPWLVQLLLQGGAAQGVPIAFQRGIPVYQVNLFPLFGSGTAPATTAARSRVQQQQTDLQIQTPPSQTAAQAVTAPVRRG